MSTGLQRVWWAWGLPALIIAVVIAVVAWPTGAHAAAPQTGTLSVTLTDASGTPITNGFAEAFTAEGQEIAETTTGTSAGVYTIDDVPVGTAYVYAGDGNTAANGDEYLGGWYGTTPGSPASDEEADASPITVSANATTPITEQVATAASITGIAKNSAGDPLGGGEAILYSPDGDQVDSTAVGYGSTAGQYTFSDLYTGSYRIAFEGQDTGGDWENSTTGMEEDDADGFYSSSGLVASFPQSSAVSASANAAATTVNVSVPTATSISGSVTANGNPAGDVQVTLTNAAGQPTLDSYAFQQNANLIPETDNTPSDAGYGTYIADHLIPGVAYKVMFNPEGGYDEAGGDIAFGYWDNASTLADATTVTPTVGAPATAVDAALVTGGTISGTVTDATSQSPLNDVGVFVFDAAGNLVAVGFTDQDGNYAVPGLPTGKWYVEFDPYDTYDISDLVTWYGGASSEGSSTPVAVTDGQTTSGTDIALKANTTAEPTTTQTVTVQSPQGAAPSGLSTPTIVGSTPTITGTDRVGDTLHAVVGSWTAGTGFSYVWLANGQPIRGATASALTLTSADLNKRIAVEVVGAESGYYSTLKQSTVTRSVTAGLLHSTAPRILGRADVGDRLAARTGNWTRGTRFSYAWYAGKRAIRGAHRSSYTLTRADRGQHISVRVTGRQAGYRTVSRLSRGTAEVG